MDKATCKGLGAELEKAAREIAERHGLKAIYKGGTYDPKGSAVLKVEFAEAGTDGVVMTREAQDFKQLAHVYGLEPQDLGRTATIRGESYTVVGLLARSRAYPVLVQRADGKRLKMAAEPIAAALGHKAKAPMPTTVPLHDLL